MATAVKITKLRLDIRQRIVRLKNIGKSSSAIVTILKEEENILTTQQSVNRLLRRYRLRGTVVDAHRSGRPRKYNIDHLDFIDAETYANREITGEDLMKRFNERFPDCQLSVTSIGKLRRKLGWVREKTRYCQMVREVNKPKRREWCLRQLANREQFNDVIFTDESKVELQKYTSTTWRKKDEPYIERPKPKHPLSVYVWAGISRRGATAIVIFTGIMNSEGYQTVLQQGLLPFLQSHYPDGHRLYQDNDPKHTSRSTKAWMAENHVNHWPTPPESPDLNPIENLWANMKRFLRKNVKPSTKDELIAGIEEFWQTVSPHMCNRYINHIFKVMPAVIARNGAASGY